MSGAYVVTGAGRGIGRVIVERLAKQDPVVAVDLDADTLTWTGSLSSVTAVAGDAAAESTAVRAVEAAFASGGHLAGWVNNAAVFRDASVHSASPENILELIDLNLRPAVVGCTVAVRAMLPRKSGAIVNVSSHQARQAVSGCLPYVTAKAAIEGMTRALAVEYGPHGIRVNAVALGSIRTERYDEFLAAQGDAAARVRAQMATVHPLGRVGEPEEVADAVAYLLSPQASFINGVTLPVDGGRTVKAHDPEG